MKKILKNNSIIITALCIMIVIVWYLNSTADPGADTQVANGDKVQMETVQDEAKDNQILTENGMNLTQLMADENAGKTNLSQNGLELETAEGYGDNSMFDISDEDIAKVDETQNETAQQTAEGDEEVAEAEVKPEESLTVADNGEVQSGNEESNTSTPGEAVLASTTINSSYFASAKLTREQNRAREKESLMEMMESDTLTEELKQQAVSSYLALNETMEKENATELLLEAKGFDGAVVSIVKDSVEVVINAPTITEQEIAQIESIVKRKTEVAAENIVISPVVVEE